MDIQATKAELIAWLKSVNDTSVLKQVTAIKDQKDWWDTISEKERKAIDDGIEQIEQGKGIPHDEVMSSVRSQFKL